MLETKHRLFGLECFMFNGMNGHRIWPREDQIKPNYNTRLSVQGARRQNVRGSIYKPVSLIILSKKILLQCLNNERR